MASISRRSRPCLSLVFAALAAGCGSPPAPEVAVTPREHAPSAASSAAIVQAGFVPLLPFGGLAPATQETAAPCRVTEHALGPLANPGDNLFPVQLAADAQGALAAWMGPRGLMLQRFDATGAPAGDALSAPVSWRSPPVVLLSREEVVLVAAEPTSITAARFERNSLRAVGSRTVPRPKGMERIVESALFDGELVVIGTHDRDLTFFRFAGEGAPLRATSLLPAPLPDDPIVIIGRWDGEPAALITTHRSGTWLASGSRVERPPPASASPVTGRSVRPVVLDFRTEAISFGLQIEPRDPLSRREYTDIQEPKPVEAFRITGTYGFPVEGRTGSHFLFAQAAGKSEPSNLDKLEAQVSTVRCGGK